jgi:hypothetical protein
MKFSIQGFIFYTRSKLFFYLYFSLKSEFFKFRLSDKQWYLSGIR